MTNGSAAIDRMDLGLAAQIDLLTDTLGPVIQRELVHRGLLAENQGYDACLVGRAENL